MYPPVTDERDALEMPATDFVSTWSMRNYSRNAGLKNGGNIWRYVYAHAFSFIKAWGHLTFVRTCLSWVGTSTFISNSKLVQSYHDFR